MTTYAPHLEVGQKRLWCDVGVKNLSVSEFPHQRILNNGEDDLRSISPRRLVGAAFSELGLVRRFRARTDDGSGIFIDCHILGANTCGFDELQTLACCVSCHWTNYTDEVVCAPRFFVSNLDEEHRHDLHDSSQVGV